MEEESTNDNFHKKAIVSHTGVSVGHMSQPRSQTQFKYYSRVLDHTLVGLYKTAFYMNGEAEMPYTEDVFDVVERYIK